MNSENNSMKPFTGKSCWIWGEGGRWQTLFNKDTPYRTCYFRKRFNVPNEGAKLKVNVSADSRYTLFVNGKLVCKGPAKGDITHQFYDTLELDAYLQPGSNIIAAVVVSFSPVYTDYGNLGSPVSVMTVTPAFILDGQLTDITGNKVLDSVHTDSSWESCLDFAYTHHTGQAGIICDLGENLDYSRYPEGWERGVDSDSAWKPAVVLGSGVTRESVFDSSLPYRMTPRLIPFLQQINGDFVGVYDSKGLEKEACIKCIKGESRLQIPRNSEVKFILDVGELTTAYPVISFSGGNGSIITITYSEALYKDGRKINRHIPESCDIEGLYDSVVSDGGSHSYEPMHWRTFRYVKIEVSTGDDPFLIDRLFYRFSAYPLYKRAEFTSSDPRHEKIWNMTFRTLQLCCHETYEDCPYYEQLQYAGDSQVVSLVAGYMSGDWSLTRQAILMFNWSRDFEGITKSRYPSRVPQIIPSWSLLWIVMTYEYWWHTGDILTVKECIDGVSAVMKWFEKHLNEDYLLYNLPYWKVVDWVKEWDNPAGCPPGAHGGVTGLISAQYAYVLKIMPELFRNLGDQGSAEHYRYLYHKIIDSINRYCWDDKVSLYKDSPHHEIYSELGNAWAILSEAAGPERADIICRQLNTNPLLAKATLYGRYYVFRALEKGKRYEKFPDLLDWWHIMMDTDLTTWPEEPWLGRSYCHAWSCTPSYEFLSQVLGVKPLKPGFEDILIEPQPCGLKWARGKVPTPKGFVSVEWEISGNEFILNLSIPAEAGYKVNVPPQFEGRTRISVSR